MMWAGRFRGLTGRERSVDLDQTSPDSDGTAIETLYPIVNIG
jgi:hypothetical protein